MGLHPHPDGATILAQQAQLAPEGTMRLERLADLARQALIVGHRGVQHPDVPALQRLTPRSQHLAGLAVEQRQAPGTGDDDTQRRVFEHRLELALLLRQLRAQAGALCAQLAQHLHQRIHLAARLRPGLQGGGIGLQQLRRPVAQQRQRLRQPGQQQQQAQGQQ